MPAPHGIEEGGNDAMPACFVAEHRRVAKKREDIGFRKQPAESIQNLFAATAIQKPVMHQGRAHVVYQLTAGSGERQAPSADYLLP